MSPYCVFIVAILSVAPQLHAVPQQKATSDLSSKVDAVDTNGNTFAGNIQSEGHVLGAYKSSNGSTGPVTADSTAGDSNKQYLAATWQGKRQSGDLDKTGNAIQLKDSNGDGVDTEAKGSQNVPVVVKAANGSQLSYHVKRPTDDQAVVVDDKTGKTKYTITGITNKDNVNIVGGPQPYNANFQAKKDGNGNVEDINTRLKQKTFLNVGPAYDTNVYTNDKTKHGVVKGGWNPLDTGSSNPLTAISPSVTLNVDKVKTQSCPEGNYGDGFGQNGFVIDDKSITADVPPTVINGSLKTYSFPTCFIMKAQVKIPPNIKIEDVAGQVTAYISPIGNLQCEAAKECADTTTSNRPQGNCFYCDFCVKGTKNSKSGAVFGSQSEVSSNLCTALPNQLLPLEWKVCPPENATKYDVFQKDLFGIFKTDMDATIRIYTKSSSTKKPTMCNNVLALFNTACKPTTAGDYKAWETVGCRQAIISYSVSVPQVPGAAYGNSARSSPFG